MEALGVICLLVGIAIIAANSFSRFFVAFTIVDLHVSSIYSWCEWRDYRMGSSG